MKIRYCIVCLLLFLCMFQAKGQGTAWSDNNMYNQPSSMVFRSTTASYGTYCIPVAAQDLGSVGEASAPTFDINPKYNAGPGIIGKDDETSVPGDLPSVPNNTDNNDDPVGDGTWVLLSCACLFLLLRIISARKNANRDVKE